MARHRRRSYPLKIDWTRPAAEDLRQLVNRAPVQARAVFRAANWLCRVEAVADVARSAGPDRPPEERYWPVPPQGIFFVKDEGRWTLTVTAIEDARRRRERW